MSAMWVFRPGRRIAHARTDYGVATAPCGQAISGTKPLSTYDLDHVGIRPCERCRRSLAKAGAR